MVISGEISFSTLYNVPGDRKFYRNVDNIDIVIVDSRDFESARVILDVKRNSVTLYKS